MLNFIDQVIEIANPLFLKTMGILFGLLSVFGINSPTISYTSINNTEEPIVLIKEIKKEEISVNKEKENIKQKETKKTILINKSQSEKILSQQTILNEIKIPIIIPKTLIPLDKLNTNTKKVLVNILCTTKIGGSFKPITGSGVIIDKKGIILTNAHVAQYFLLKNYQSQEFLNCIIRSGNPAKATYKAELLHLSSRWLGNNFKNITKQNPKGTGQDDYALLLIKKLSSNSSPLPKEFPSIEIDISQNKLKPGIPLLMAGYPAGFLGGISIQKDLWQVSSLAKIKKLFYFDIPYNLDLFSIGGNIIAQKGSSGGVAVNQSDGKLVGIIVTSTITGSTDKRDLRAITLAHINRSFRAETGEDLKSFLSKDINKKLIYFNNQKAPALKGLLFNELNK